MRYIREKNTVTFLCSNTYLPLHIKVPCEKRARIFMTHLQRFEAKLSKTLDQMNQINVSTKTVKLNILREAARRFDELLLSKLILLRYEKAVQLGKNKRDECSHLPLSAQREQLYTLYQQGDFLDKLKKLEPLFRALTMSIRNYSAKLIKKLLDTLFCCFPRFSLHMESSVYLCSWRCLLDCIKHCLSNNSW